MIAKYKRTARTFSELDLGALLPLHEAILELREEPGAAYETLLEEGVEGVEGVG